MSYRSCRHGEHSECNGYVGVHDTYVCDCRCHGPWGEDGRRRTPAPWPSTYEQAVIDRFGIFAVEHARDQFCEAIRGYSEDRWCAQWMRGVVDAVRKEGGIWLIHAARSRGWPIGLDGEDGWDPMTDDENEAVVAFMLDLVKR